MRLTWIRLPGTAAHDSSSALEDRGPIRGEALSLEDLEARARTLSSSFTLAKDRRTGWETSDTTRFLDGDLDGCIEAYLKWSASGGKLVHAADD